MSILHKVTAFVTRGEGAARELLVFRHPNAGVQLPAGTVGAGEEIEEAVLREVWEEAGLPNVILLGELDTFQQPLTPGERILLKTLQLRREPRADAPPVPYTLKRGMTVQLLGERDSWDQVRYEEREIGVERPALLACVSGWAAAESLSAQVERHLFHLCLAASAAGEWTHYADGQHFRFYWVPLGQNPGVVSPQGSYLARVRQQLLG
jgi:8-oxo-dGTP pyrophosphatase MutT (NUDIX family)